MEKVGRIFPLSKDMSKKRLLNVFVYVEKTSPEEPE